MNGNLKLYLFAIIAIITIMSGCTLGLVPLKGKYPVNPLEVTSSKSVDSIWMDLAELFARKGLRVKGIDKRKGLIVTNKTSFIPAYTVEDKDGHPKEPDAWVVLPVTIVNGKERNPKLIYGQWSIQITQAENGATLVKVDPIVICTYFPNILTSVETRGQSTGKLEELIRVTQKQ